MNKSIIAPRSSHKCRIIRKGKGLDPSNLQVELRKDEEHKMNIYAQKHSWQIQWGFSGNIGFCVFQRINSPLVHRTLTWPLGWGESDLTFDYMADISFCSLAGGLLPFWWPSLSPFCHCLWLPCTKGAKEKSLIFHCIHLQRQSYTRSQFSSGEVKIGKVS